MTWLVVGILVNVIVIYQQVDHLLVQAGLLLDGFVMFDGVVQ